VIPTLCVPTRKDPTSVAVLVATKETAGAAQVSFYCFLGSLVQGSILVAVYFLLSKHTNKCVTNLIECPSKQLSGIGQKYVSSIRYCVFSLFVLQSLQ